MKKLLIFPVLALSINSAFTQVIIPGTYQNDYFKLLNIKNKVDDNPISLTPSIFNYYNFDSLEWDVWQDQKVFGNVKEKNFNVLSPTISTIYNDNYAKGINDGPVWNGKGINSSLTFGFFGKMGILHYTFSPVIYYAQNKNYRRDAGPFNKNLNLYQFEKNIDWVLKYGDNPLYKFHPGQSELRLIFNNATIGLSTQNMSWGPSLNNPILMSKNAPGFPHLDIGTATPAKTKIGLMEFKSYWGFLNESDYFDNNPDNNKRYIVGMTFGYHPKYVDGLSIGFNRVMYRLPFDNDFKFKDVFAHAVTGLIEVSEYKNVNGSYTNDFYDQMMSVFLKWAFEDTGFEMYLEYARNDFPGTLADFLEQPDRTRAYNLGMMKVIEIDNNKALKVFYEHTTLGSNKTALVSASPTYYVHGIIKQGYTNDGQLVGAPVGPGANADLIQLDYYYPKGKLGFYYHRNRYNDDYFFSVYNKMGEDFPHDVEHTLNLNHVYFWNNWTLETQLSMAIRRNWYYDDDSDAFKSFQPIVRLTYIIK